LVEAVLDLDISLLPKQEEEASAGHVDLSNKTNQPSQDSREQVGITATSA
jgi:hypothetical protein